MQNARSNAVSSVRQRAGFLYSLKQEYFDIAFDRGSVPELQALLKLPKKNGDLNKADPYVLLAPVLFDGHKYDPTLKTLFKNPLLPKVFLF